MVAHFALVPRAFCFLAATTIMSSPCVCDEQKDGNVDADGSEATYSLEAARPRILPLRKSNKTCLLFLLFILLLLSFAAIHTTKVTIAESLVQKQQQQQRDEPSTSFALNKSSLVSITCLNDMNNSRTKVGGTLIMHGDDTNSVNKKSNIADEAQQPSWVPTIVSKYLSHHFDTMHMYCAHFSFNLITSAQLSGEMGNNLGKIAHGYGLAWWLQQDYGNANSVLLRHQENPKWVRGRDALQKCFPNSRAWDFRAANTLEFLSQKEGQKKWLGEQFGEAPGGKTRGEIDKYLQEFLALKGHEKARPADGQSNNISLPFLYANKFVQLSAFMDRFYDDYRKLFQFDNISCCNLMPEPDESVFVSHLNITKLKRSVKNMVRITFIVILTLASITNQLLVAAFPQFYYRNAQSWIQPRI